jgi:hypothetical protein
MQMSLRLFWELRRRFRFTVAFFAGLMRNIALSSFRFFARSIWQTW